MVKQSEVNRITQSNGFRSTLHMSKQSARKILQDKIHQERQKVRLNMNRANQNQEKQLHQNVHYDPDKINVLSLFSGASGLDLGVQWSGIAYRNNARRYRSNPSNEYDLQHDSNRVHLMYTNDSDSLANTTYAKNFSGDYVQDGRPVQQILSFPPSDLIIGGFPCPGFSVAGPRLIDDDRNFLYIHYLRALVDSQPASFIAENVKGILTIGHGEALRQIIEDFSNVGYRVRTHLVNAKDYGVPQSRERVFIVGVRDDLVREHHFEYHLPKATHGEKDGQANIVTLSDAIGDLT